MNRRIRALAGALALATALAAPASTLASTAGGSTTESLTKAATIALVVPASVTYANAQTGDATASLPITGIETDNPTGLRITLSVNATGGNSISRSSRSTEAFVASSGLSGSSAIAQGGWVSNNGSAVVAQSAGAVTGGTASSVSHVNTSGYAPGTYTGQLDWLAETK